MCGWGGVPLVGMKTQRKQGDTEVKVTLYREMRDWPR